VHVLQRLALAANDDCASKARLLRQIVSMLGRTHLHAARNHSAMMVIVFVLSLFFR
jgi:hypothetical protein